MQLKTKLFEVTLDEGEVMVLTTLLHESYQARKVDYEAYRKSDNEGNAADAYALMHSARTIRNFFANLIGRSYMGEDA